MCGESWTSPARMPQFEALAVDTIQDCDSTICRLDCLHFPALTWILRFSTQLNAPSCSPETEPPPHRLSVCLAPSLRRWFPYISEIAATCRRGTPGSNTHLEKQHYYLQLTLNFKCIKRGEQSFRERKGGRGWKDR